MTIHTVGDSHSIFGWKDINGCETHHLGPILCYSFGRDKLKRFDIRNLAINHGDSIVFCMGEIDCRCHIHKHVTPLRPYTTIIEEIVYEYMNAIKLSVQNCVVELKAVCIFNVVPPVKKHETVENPIFPYLGSDQDRKMYVLYFNACLQKKCKENDFTYIDVYKSYTDKDGFLNKQYSDGVVHIKNPCYIKESVTKLI
jgi:hypothetical protein